MSFHGGVVGIIIVTYLFSQTNTKKTFKLYHPRDYNYFEACRTKLGWALPIENFKND